MAGHVPVSVETVLTRCHVITSVELATMAVHLVGWVINVTRVSLIFIESSALCCVSEFVPFNFGCLFRHFFSI